MQHDRDVRAIRHTAIRSEIRILGESASTARVRATVERLALDGTAAVLLTGEDGVGKTWVAQALHAASLRRPAPCILFACARAYEPEIGLFGVPAGAPGLNGGGVLAAAHEGTVILDDVERLPAAVQRRLLDWSRQPRPSGPALVGLTTAEQPAGPLCEWLGQAQLAVAPLRERMADLRPLAHGFLARLADLAHLPSEGLTPTAEDRLLAYRWPGNVAELATVIERAARRGAGGPIGVQHLDLPERPAPAGWEPAGEPRPLRDVTDEYIAHVLRLAGGNRTRAARLLGVARETLRTRIRSRAAAY